MRSKVALFACALCLMVGLNAHTALALPGLGTISGYVVDGQGAPIVGANVDFNSADGNVQVGSPGTDENGFYTSDELPPGDYAVLVSESSGSYAAARVDTVSVLDQQDTRVATVTLPAGGWISGTVRDDVGRPVPGATVMLMNPSEFPAFIRVAVSRSDGTYSMLGGGGWPNLDGYFLLVACASDHRSTFFGGAADRATATLVHFSAGDQLSGRNFVLPRAPRIDDRMLPVTVVPATSARKWWLTASAGRIAWIQEVSLGQDSDGMEITRSDLFVKSGAAAPSAIATDVSGHWDTPRLSGNWLVYARYVTAPDPESSDSISLYAYNFLTRTTKLIASSLDFNSTFVGLDGNVVVYSGAPASGSGDSTLSVCDLATDSAKSVASIPESRLLFKISKGKILYWGPQPSPGAQRAAYLYDLASESTTPALGVGGGDPERDYDLMAFDYPNLMCWDPKSMDTFDGLFRGSPVVVNVTTGSRTVLSSFGSYGENNVSMSGRWCLVGDTLYDALTRKSYRIDDSAPVWSTTDGAYFWYRNAQGATKKLSIASLSYPRVATRTTLSTPTSVRVRATLRASGTIYPLKSCRVTITKTRLVGTTWRSMGTVTVTASSGRFYYSFRPAYRGKWRMVATYSGGVVGTKNYLPSRSVTRTVKVY